VSHVQYQRATGFDDGDRPARSSPERNLVTHGEVLILRENAGGARTIQIAKQPVE
jgi:hypothetical protein